MGVKKTLTGEGMERMPDFAFRVMSFFFKIRDLFNVDKKLEEFGIKEGDTVVDYGCGPGGFLKKASELAGENGTVYAVDIHELAIESVKKRIAKENLANVRPVLADGYTCDIEDHSADLLYALDMFHMISDPGPFLEGLHKLLKKGGILILEDGHQPREKTIEKVKSSGLWEISEETRGHLKCSPL